MAPKIDKALRSGSVSDSQISLDDIMNRIKLLDSTFDARFDKFEKVMESRFSKLIADKVAEILISFESKIKEVVCEFSNSIDGVQKEFQGLLARTKALELKVESLERVSKSTDVLVNGVSAMPNEDIKAIISNICRTVKYESAKPIAFRLRKNNNKTPAIVVKFPSTHLQKQFFSAVKRSKPKLSDIGFAGSTGIFVQKSLSSKSLQLFRNAMQLKRQNRITSVFTNNGIVYIRRSAEGSPVVVTSDLLAEIAE